MCQNGGVCVSKWNTYSCDCPTGYGGKNCEQGEKCDFLVSTNAMELSFETVKKFVSLCGQSGASLDNRACICLWMFTYSKCVSVYVCVS